MGEEYWRVKQFVDDKFLAELNDGSVGQYMISCVEHLDKCLEPYREEVIGLQSEAPCLSYLYSRIYPYSEVMQGLALMVQELNICEKKGTAILETLDKHLNTSIGAFHAAAKLWVSHLLACGYGYGSFTSQYTTLVPGVGMPSLIPIPKVGNILGLKVWLAMYGISSLMKIWAEIKWSLGQNILRLIGI